MPARRSQYATTPSVGLNRNIHNTPAIAGATAYGQIRSVLYTPAPRTTRSANTASTSDTTRPSAATSTENHAVTLNEARYNGSWNSSLKLSNQTNCRLP